MSAVAGAMVVCRGSFKKPVSYGDACWSAAAAGVESPRSGLLCTVQKASTGMLSRCLCLLGVPERLWQMRLSARAHVGVTGQRPLGGHVRRGSALCGALCLVSSGVGTDMWPQLGVQACPWPPVQRFTAATPMLVSSLALRTLSAGPGRQTGGVWTVLGLGDSSHTCRRLWNSQG